MTRMDELKVEFIDCDYESKRRFGEYSSRLQTAVMFGELRDQLNLYKVVTQFHALGGTKASSAGSNGMQ